MKNDVAGRSFKQQVDDILQPYVIERALFQLKKKSPGPDHFPKWLWGACSFELADPISCIYKRSLLSGIIPDKWREALVKPLPKVDNPSAISDYRPISVTCILSRLLEKIIVKNFLYPLMNTTHFQDQFGFKPLGSTTSALQFLIHNVTQMLEHCTYVRCLLIDFSKAFDVIDREILLHKLRLHNVNPYVIRWIASFLSDRVQAVSINNAVSNVHRFNLGVIQGSVIGPALFSFMISDLKPISRDNALVKFADDATLIAPEKSDTDISDEFSNVLSWATANKMTVNMAKTKEIVFHRPHPSKPPSPPPITGVERIMLCKLLGVTLQHDLRFSSHVSELITSCSQRMFLLRSLKGKGLTATNIEIIFNAIIIGRIIYALPVWGSYLTAHDMARIDKLFSRCQKYGYCKAPPTFNALLKHADTVLFKAIQSPLHPLHSILPLKRPLLNLTRFKGHDYAIPNVKFDLYKKSFLIRSLFNFI